MAMHDQLIKRLINQHVLKRVEERKCVTKCEYNEYATITKICTLCSDTISGCVTCSDVPDDVPDCTKCEDNKKFRTDKKCFKFNFLI